MRFHSFLKSLACFTIILTCHSNAALQRLLPDDGKAEDHFGYSVAIDGTTALVGAFKADANGVVDSGAAYIYSLGVSGWEQQAKLVAEPARADDTLGGNVALNKHIAAVGVIGRDDKSNDAGAVVIFERDTQTWSQKQILTPFDAKPADAFGQRIALTEQFLVIGSPIATPLTKTLDQPMSMYATRGDGYFKVN